MKEAVTKVIDTLQKLLERYYRSIAAGGDYFEGDYSFMCVLSIKVSIRKKSANLLIILVYTILNSLNKLKDKLILN